VSYAFDSAIEVRRIADGTYSAEVHDGWDIMGNANGGYAMALVANAMRAECERPDPITITLHYLAPLPPGPVTITADVVKRGRRFSTVRAALVHNGRTAIVAVAAFGDLADGGHEPRHVESAPPELPPFEQCPARGSSDVPSPFGLVQQLDMRLHPDDTGFALGAPSGASRIRGWFAFADARPIDTFGVLLALDAFPPPVLNLPGVVGWVPTIELTVHMRAKPAPGLLRCAFESRIVQGDTCVEDGEAWDSTGVCVAQVRQIGLMPN
jgi:acyl-CoA thioesterase